MSADDDSNGVPEVLGRVTLQPGVPVDECRFDHCRDRTAPCTDHPELYEFEAGDTDSRAEPHPAPAVPEVLEDLPDLEAMPERVLPNIFECSRGHRQIGSHEDFLTNRRPGFPDVKSGAQCLQCKFEWFGEVFPTRDTGVQYVPEPRKQGD